MPPQIQQLLQNKRLLAVLGGTVLLILVVIIIAVANSGHGGKEGSVRRLHEDEKTLATVNSMGKAIEIQALMARENVNLVREDGEGGKEILKFSDTATTVDRDKALLTLVQSGLMDQNVGLELFDKGDLTASREEKRIKLIRAMDGELARLIRKIPPIQDSSVFISIPEPTIFREDMAPTTATVQVTLGPGERLTRDKVRSVINLLMGSIQNLDAKHISLTDTNGVVYNSVMDAADQLMDKLEERDHYMEQKVRTQLDRLVGHGKYVVTVATYLREAPKTQMALDYQPQQSSVSKSSTFQENLNSQEGGAGAPGGPVSSYIPKDMDISATGGDHSQKGYHRTGQEVQYNAGKQETTENFVPGMMEDISVAVTIDGGAFPTEMNMDQFKQLVANSASPLVRPQNVTVVVGKPENITPIPHDIAQTQNLNIPWWVWAIVGGVAFIFFLILIKAVSKPGVPPQVLQQHQREIEQLRDLANNQAQQLQLTQQQAQQMIQAQQQQMAQISTQQAQSKVDDNALVLKQTLSELQEVFGRDEEEENEDALGSEIKSWIEST